MSDQGNDTLNESLKGYKEKINPLIKASLTWDKDLIFTGRTQEGYEIDFDALNSISSNPNSGKGLRIKSDIPLPMKPESAEDRAFKFVLLRFVIVRKLSWGVLVPSSKRQRSVRKSSSNSGLGRRDFTCFF